MRENAPSDSRSSWVLADNRVIVVLVLDFLELFDHWVFPATSCVIWWQDGRGGTCPWHNHPPRPGLRQRTAPCTFCGSAESENHHDDLSASQPLLAIDWFVRVCVCILDELSRWLGTTLWKFLERQKMPCDIHRWLSINGNISGIFILYIEFIKQMPKSWEISNYKYSIYSLTRDSKIV